MLVGEEEICPLGKAYNAHGDGTNFDLRGDFGLMFAAARAGCGEGRRRNGSKRGENLIDVGLVGFGLGGRCFHAPVIRAVKGLRLAAIVQRTGDEAKNAYPEARIARSLDKLLDIDTIRLVVISTPNQTHFPFALRCLQSGRDVVVDKPFTNTVQEATELVQTAKRLRRVMTVYHDRRFDADFQARLSRQVVRRVR